MTGDRRAALWQVRRALLILCVPAALNVVCDHFFVISRLPARIFFDAIILFWLTAWILVIWFAGLRILEALAVMIHFVFGGAVSQQEWLSVMHRSLWPLKWAAALGALLWALWLYLIFLDRSLDALQVSFVLSTCGHLLGAWVYLTVFFNWYKARARAGAETS